MAITAQRLKGREPDPADVRVDPSLAEHGEVLPDEEAKRDGARRRAQPSSPAFVTSPSTKSRPGTMYMRYFSASPGAVGSLSLKRSLIPCPMQASPTLNVGHTRVTRAVSARESLQRGAGFGAGHAHWDHASRAFGQDALTSRCIIRLSLGGAPRQIPSQTNNRLGTTSKSYVPETPSLAHLPTLRLRSWCRRDGEGRPRSDADQECGWQLWVHIAW